MHRLIACLLLALAIAGCSSTSAPAPTPVPTPTPVPPTPTPTPAQIAQLAATAMESVHSAHFVMAFEGQPPVTGFGFQLNGAEGDMVAPDTLHAKLKAKFGQNPIDSELIVLGSDKLLKNPLNGKWETLTLPIGSLALLDKDHGAPYLLRSLKDVASAGGDSVDSVSTDVLTGTLSPVDLAPLVTGLPPATDPVQTQVWIGASDRIGRKVRLTGPVSPGEPPTIIRTLTLTALNQNVQIERPS